MILPAKHATAVNHLLPKNEKDEYSNEVRADEIDFDAYDFNEDDVKESQEGNFRTTQG